MNCEQVKMILADYRDGTITESERAMVDAHLKVCGDCREELRFLKKYKTAISRYPALQAPDGLLEEVHRGIESQKRGGIVRALFFPLRVKVPLEAAALLALALTGVLIFKPYKTSMLDYSAEHQTAVTRQSAPSGADAARAAATNERRTAKIDGAARDKKREAPAAPEREGISVTATSRQDAPLTEKSADAREVEEITISMRMKAAPAEEPAPGDSVRQEESESTAGVLTGDARKALRSNAMTGTPRAMKAGPAGRDTKTTETIDGLARSLGGKIIQEERDDETDGVRSVVVELPAGNYNQFIGGMKARWTILGQTPAAPPAGTGTVRITMHVRD